MKKTIEAFERAGYRVIKKLLLGEYLVENITTREKEIWCLNPTKQFFKHKNTELKK